MRSLLLLTLVAAVTAAVAPAPAAQPHPAAAPPACAWAALYDIRVDAAAQKANAAAVATADDPDSPAARPAGVVVAHAAARPTGGCSLPGAPAPLSPAAARAAPRVPAALKAGLAPLPATKPAEPEAARAGAAPARQQLAPPGPPGPIPYNALIIKNNITEDIYIVAAGVEFTRPGYYPGVPASTPADRWAVRGWYVAKPGQLVQVFTTRANKAWFYAQTNTGSLSWGGATDGGVVVDPEDVPFSAAAGGYVSPYTTATPPTPVIQPYHMRQVSFTNGLFDGVNMDVVVELSDDDD